MQFGFDYESQAIARTTPAVLRCCSDYGCGARSENLTQPSVKLLRINNSRFPTYYVMLSGVYHAYTHVTRCEGKL